MNNATVNFLDKNAADKLAGMGFCYTENNVGGGRTVYTFFCSPKLLDAIGGEFSESKDFYYSKKLFL